jgi:hypothetical protein
VHWIKDVRRDVVVALRRLLHAPVFTLFSVVTLALGIGATTAIYSVIYAAVLRPPAARLASGGTHLGVHATVRARYGRIQW